MVLPQDVFPSSARKDSYMGEIWPYRSKGRESYNYTKISSRPWNRFKFTKHPVTIGTLWIKVINKLNWARGKKIYWTYGLTDRPITIRLHHCGGPLKFTCKWLQIQIFHIWQFTKQIIYFWYALEIRIQSLVCLSNYL